jgi:hypothetical protein
VVEQQVLVHGSDVCGSERLSKRVYGEASFTGAPTVAGSLPVTAKPGTDHCIFRSLHFCKPLPSLHEVASLTPPASNPRRSIEELDTKSARKRSTTRVGGCQTVQTGGLENTPSRLQRKRRRAGNPQKRCRVRSRTPSTSTNSLAVALFSSRCGLTCVIWVHGGPQNAISAVLAC